MARDERAALPPAPFDLGRFALFRDADPALLAPVQPRIVEVRVPAGATLLDFGDRSTELFLIAEGAVRVVSRGPNGEELVLGDLGAGEVFGELAAIDDAPRSACVTALNRSRLGRMPADVFRAIVTGSPPVMLHLLHLLTARIRSLDERIFELVALPVRLRLCADLLRLGRLRRDGSHVVTPPPPQHVLAARIGARREAVSRELAALARAGLISRGGSAIVVPDPERLRAMVQAGHAQAKGRAASTRGSPRV